VTSRDGATRGGEEARPRLPAWVTAQAVVAACNACGRKERERGAAA
jgi:hypothetical protein